MGAFWCNSSQNGPEPRYSEAPAQERGREDSINLACAVVESSGGILNEEFQLFNLVVAEDVVILL